jgi:hypothetical protein
LSTRAPASFKRTSSILDAVAFNVPSAEDLKKLSPEERIKMLRRIEEERRKELEDTRKQVEEELAAAEKLIETSEEEIEDEDRKEQEKRVKIEKQREEESLEERLAGAPKQNPEQQTGKQYENTGLYDAFDRLEKQLGELYKKEEPWNQRDIQNYNQAKEEIEKTQSYRLTSETLESEFGIVTGAFNRLKYKR